MYSKVISVFSSLQREAFISKGRMEGSLEVCLQSVTKSFCDENRQITILKNINACFQQGKTHAIVGASGVGKSTLLHLIAGLDKPTSGKILIGSDEISSLSSLERASKIGLVFQSPYLIKEFSVIENVMLAGKISGLSEIECKKKALYLLKEVELEQTENWEIGKLSGGQRQRITLARALMNEPSFLIADEPTGNLDEVTGNVVMSMILSYQKKSGMGIIISSHNPAVTSLMEKVFILKNGCLIESVEFVKAHEQRVKRV